MPQGAAFKGDVADGASSYLWLRMFASAVLEMPEDVRAQLRAHLVRVSEDDALAVVTRTRAGALAELIGVVDGDDRAAALARCGELAAMGRQSVELHNLPTANRGGA